MPGRTARARIAEETLAILERGSYQSSTGEGVSIAAGAAAARTGSVLYAPDDFPRLGTRRDERLQARGERHTTTFEVVNETTLSTVRRLLRQDGVPRVLALNFASARNPGGGFLKGSQAQEESLARASALFPCLDQFRTSMYEINRRFPSCFYTDHMILSPEVPVFRDDDDALLNEPFPVSILTAPAVNAGAVAVNEPSQRGRIPGHPIPLHIRRAVAVNEPSQRGRIEEVMRARIEKVLSVAVVHEHETIVLGAWGCGVFANDPEQVAGWFADALLGAGTFRGAFRRVAFAVLDRSATQTFISPFEKRFEASHPSRG